MDGRWLETTPVESVTHFMPSTFTLPELWRSAAVPIRRVFFRRWFTTLARIGSKGNAEVFLDPELVTGKPNTYVGEWSEGTERSGEIFLYVNNAVLPFPWIYDLFYRDHAGTAEIVIRRCAETTCL